MKVSKTETKALRVVESYLVVINTTLLTALVGFIIGYTIY